MRTLAIGDIHGCSTALRTLLDAVQPGAADLLVTLGDYVDRGPDSRGVIDTLLDLETRTQLVALTGNHEILLFEALAGAVNQAEWEAIGGRQTLRSYGGSIRVGGGPATSGSTGRRVPTPTTGPGRRRR